MSLTAKSLHGHMPLYCDSVIALPSSKIALCVELPGIPEPALRRGDRQLIYFGRATSGHVKIGCSVKPLERMMTLSEPAQVRKHLKLGINTAQVELLLCVAPGWFGRERAIHAALEEERRAGEWFRGPRTDELIARLSDGASTFEKVFATWEMKRRRTVRPAPLCPDPADPPSSDEPREGAA